MTWITYILQNDILGGSIIPPIASIVAFMVLLTIIWNISKKFTTLENDSKAGKEQHINDIKELKEKINEIEKNAIQRISEAKLERKEEISKAVGNNISKFEGLQKQIDGSRSDLKDVSTRVTQVNTKIESMEKTEDDLKREDQNNVSFFTDWIQRVEDRIEHARAETCELRNQFVNIFSSFHGAHGNNHTPAVKNHND